MGTVLVVVLALTASAIEMGSPVSCTPATCEGMVRLDFSGADCTGEITYYQLNEEFDVCDGYQLTEKNDFGVSFYGFINLNCDRTSSNASYELNFFKWGVCQPNIMKRGSNKDSASVLQASYLYLASVNDSYTVPAFDNQPIPAFNPIGAQCYSPDNCTLSNGQPATCWTTFYPSAGTCENPEYSDLAAEQRYDLCLNYFNNSYIKFGCFDQQGSFYAYYSDATCTQVLQVIAFRSDCSASPSQTHCNAPLTPLPITAPTPESPAPSAASSFHLSALLVLFALAAIFTAI